MTSLGILGVDDDPLNEGRLEDLLRRALRLLSRLRLAEAQRLEEEPLGPRVALGRGDKQAADDRLLHRHGDRAVSVTDGDQARGFVEHDLRQRIKRRGKFLGRGALWAAARIAGLAWREAMRLGRVTVPDGRVARPIAGLAWRCASGG